MYVYYYVFTHSLVDIIQERLLNYYTGGPWIAQHDLSRLHFMLLLYLLSTSVLHAGITFICYENIYTTMIRHNEACYILELAGLPVVFRLLLILPTDRPPNPLDEILFSKFPEAGVGGMLISVGKGEQVVTSDRTAAFFRLDASN